MEQKMYEQEERWNALSHAVGILLGIIGSVLLLYHNMDKTPYATISLVIYGFSIVLLFTASTCYHAVNSPDLKRKLRILDHISIYILIAGTYTPVTLITLVQGDGWSIFYTVWGIALVGALLKLFFTGKFEIISLLLYVLMGWLIVIDIDDVLTYVSPMGIKLLALGGIFYTVGIVFYAIRKIPYNHLIWHFFVLGGAISHFFFVMTLI